MDRDKPGEWLFWNDVLIGDWPKVSTLQGSRVGTIEHPLWYNLAVNKQMLCGEVASNES